VIQHYSSKNIGTTQLENAEKLKLKIPQAQTSPRLGTLVITSVTNSCLYFDIEIPYIFFNVMLQIQSWTDRLQKEIN
jgi:hypothetical protein